MRLYLEAELREARDAAHNDGVQALHMWRPMMRWLTAPAVFRREAEAGRPWAHLFDADLTRLRQTARRLGARVVVVGRHGEIGQHVDLCGAPLRRAILSSEFRRDCSACGERHWVRWPGGDGTLFVVRQCPECGAVEDGDLPGEAVRAWYDVTAPL